MLIFFFIITIFSAANLYFYYKLSSLINLGTSVNILTGIVIFFMTLSPVLIPVYSNRGSEKSVRIFSYTGYMWLAFLVPVFSIGVIFDLYNFALQYSGSIAGHDVGSLMLSPERAFFIPLFLSFAINVYGYFEAKNLRIERLVIKTAKLPEGVDKIRIAQISDLHLSIIVRDRALDKVIKKIGDEAPDIIVSTGDLVDGIIRHIGHLADRLKNLEARLGKYAIMGNHELYGGIKHSIRFIEESGFTLLRGTGVTVENTINIAGVDFNGREAWKYSRETPQKPEREILSGLPAGLFTLLLKHRSDVEKRSLGLFDLQLSGHTHKGQIFPMNLATMFMFQYHTGFTRLAKGSAIYVSRGTGTAGPPVRFLSAPEITIIDIVSVQSSEQ
ncbi:MAG TPA: metallophosphoesterase [Nitrospirae bacterium]|nr:metallophosphoesterase [Nitrospirota bacterium]